MSTEQPSRRPLPPEVAERVNAALRVLAESAAAEDDRDAARDEVAHFLEAHLFGLAVWRANRVDGLSAGELFQEAFVNLLALLGPPADGSAARPPEDVEHLRRAFCHLLYCRHMDELRQRSRHPGDYGAGATVPDAAARQDEADRRLRAARRLIALQDALVWLDRTHPRLSAAFKTRLLANHEIRFSQAGRSFSRVVRDQVRDKDRTFAEMGELLGCTMKEARARYLAAVEVLRERYPDLLDSGKEGE